MRKLFWMTIVTALISVMVSCAPRTAKSPFTLPHIGKWVHEDAGGKHAQVVFNPDGTGSLIFHDTVFPFEYVFDYSRKPVTVDLIGSRSGKPYRTRVIVKFLDGGTRLKWRTFFNDKRPAGFPKGKSKDTVTLQKVPAGSV